MGGVIALFKMTVITTSFEGAGVFAFVYGVVAFLCLSYDIAWTQPERNPIMTFVATSCHLGTWDCLKNNILNWPIFESAPRLSRPLAGAFEILDAQFRIYFADTFFPHPALSLTWIFSLLLSPFLLYKGLRNFGISQFYSFIGIAYYISTPGFLSTVVMSFRASKPMANFFLIVIFYLASILPVIYRTQLSQKLQNNLKVDEYKRYFPILISTIILVSLFFDETAIFGFVLTIFIVVGLLKETSLLKKIIPAFAAASAIYILVIRLLMPYLAELSGFPISEEYELNKVAIDLISTPSSIPLFFKYVYENFIIIFGDLLGYTIFFQQELYSVLVVIAALQIGIFCNFYKKNKFQALSFFVLLVVSLFFHTFLVMLANVGVWGLYWYGIFICLPFTLYLVWSLNSYNKPIFTFGLVSFIIVLNFFTFVRTNYAYKFYHYYPYNPGELGDIFTGKTNRFTIYEVRPKQSLFNLTEKIWGTYHGKYNHLNHFAYPAELSYLQAPESVWNPECKTNVINGKVVSIRFSNSTDSLIIKHEPSRYALSLTGEWQGSNKKSTYIFINQANEVTAMNEGGHCDILIIREKSITPTSWNVEPQLDANGKRLNWGNGTSWAR